MSKHTETAAKRINTKRMGYEQARRLDGRAETRTIRGLDTGSVICVKGIIEISYGVRTSRSLNDLDIRADS